MPLPWDDDDERGAADSAAPDRADPNARAIYRRLLPLYAACEAHALGRGPDPTGALETMQT